MLGHTSIVTTADIYSSVLPEIAHHAAQATADMILNAARTLPGTDLDDSATHRQPALRRRTAKPEHEPGTSRWTNRE
jgi:hypothetical protein